MLNSSLVQFTGPLLGHVENLWQELLAHGYTPLSARNVLRVAAHLSRWLEAHRLELKDLDSKTIDTFFRARRRAGYTQFRTPNALKPVLRYLDQAGVVSVSKPDVAPLGPLEQLLHEYTNYLRHERALTPGVVWQYGDCAHKFLNARFSHCQLRLSDIRAQDVISFVLKQSQGYSIGTSKLLVTGLRSFLRYLYLEGAVAMDMSGAIPTVAGWRLSGLPKGLSEAEVRRLLATCDRRTCYGRRNYALLLLMVRLGLRCCEVAALTLDDIDWRRGKIVVRGKGREEPLPLPADVGEALARHIRGNRPHPLDERHIFPRVHAPYGPLSSTGIGVHVRRHLCLAGVSPARAHRLRHTAATQMLRQGASLDNIAQVLRHRSHTTTAIYAKVDHKTLRGLVQPWPGVAS